MDTESALTTKSRSVKSSLIMLGFLLAGIFLWLSVREIDPEKVRRSLGEADRSYIFPAVLVLILFYALKAHRWRALMPAELPFGSFSVLAPMMLGFAANNIFPLRLGELVRVYCAGRILKIPKALIFATMVVERLFDFAAIACVVLIGLIIIVLDRLIMINLSMQLFVACIVLLLAGIIYFILFWFARKDHTAVIRFLPRRWRGSATQVLNNFAEGITVIDNGWKLVLILLNSLLQWLLMATCIYFAMLALSIDDPSYAVATTVLAFIVLGISLPAAPAFIGTIEYAFVFGLGLFGYSATAGLAVALYYHVLTFGFVMLVGVLCLIHYRFTSHRQS